MEELAASVTCGRMASQPTASGLSATHACCLAGATGRGLGRPARAPLALGVHTRVETLKKNKVTVGMKFRTSMASGGCRRAPSGHDTQVGSAGRAGRRVPEGSLHFKFAFPAFSASWSRVWFDVCGSQGRASCGFRALHGSFPRTLLRKQLLPPPFAA